MQNPDPTENRSNALVFRQKSQRLYRRRCIITARRTHLTVHVTSILFTSLKATNRNGVRGIGKGLVCRENAYSRKKSWAYAFYSWQAVWLRCICIRQSWQS